MIWEEAANVSNIENIFSNKNPELKEVILHPAIFVALRKNESQVINYLFDNIYTVLQIAFSNVSSPQATACFEILILMIPKIAEALINNCVFYKFANQLLTQNLQDPVVGRLSNITLKLIETCITGSLDSCGFLFKLVKYAENTGVSDLFSSLMEYKPEFEVVQHWLVNRNIAQAILQNFNEIDIDSLSLNDFESKDVEKLCSFYKMIEMGIQNPILSSLFTTKEIIKSLAIKKEFVCCIEDQRWSAIISLANSKTQPENLKPLIQLAYSFLYENLDHAHQYHGKIIDFLRITIKTSIDDSIANFLLKLIEKFPECSLLHLSILSYFRTALELKLVDDQSVQIIANQVYHAAQYTRLGTSMHATTMELFNILVKNGKKRKSVKKILDKIDGFSDYSKNQLKSYKTILKSEYGKKKSIFSFGK